MHEDNVVYRGYYVTLNERGKVTGKFVRNGVDAYALYRRLTGMVDAYYDAQAMNQHGYEYGWLEP